MRIHILGSINLDVILRVESLPRPGETMLATGSASGRGGKGANQAVAAARFGAEVTLHGAVGEDEAGDRLRAGLGREGVDIGALLRRPVEPTGKAYVMVSAAGENMIIVQSGANAEASFNARPSGESVVFLTQLETPAGAAEAMFRAARPGDLTILNAAPALEAGRALFPWVDLIIVNEGELSFYQTGAAAASERLSSPLEPSDDDLLSSSIIGAARSLLCRVGQHVVVTCGPQGALVIGETTAEAIPGQAVKVVDTTGAGDCFVGVMAAMLARGASLIEAAETANRAAAVSVQTLGADSAPRPADLQPA